jgi:hypothetical protein
MLLMLLDQIFVEVVFIDVVDVIIVVVLLSLLLMMLLFLIVVVVRWMRHVPPPERGPSLPPSVSPCFSCCKKRTH